MAVGGSITEVTCNHEVLGSKTFEIKAAEDSTYDLGGYTSASDAQGITGNGRMIDNMMPKRPFFEVSAVWDMNNTADLEFAQACQDSPVLGDWIITHINGTVYALKGKPVGDLQANGNSVTFTLRVEGEGQMKKLA